MAKSGVEKARELRKKAEKVEKPEPKPEEKAPEDNPEDKGEKPPEDPTKTDKPVEMKAPKEKETDKPEQVATPEKPEPEEKKPEAEKKPAESAPAGDEVKAKLQERIDKVQENYDNLRRHTTRVSQENARLKSQLRLREIRAEEEGRKETTEIKPDESVQAPAKTEAEIQVATQVVDAANVEIDESLRALKEAESDYPELVAPIRKNLNALTGIVKTLNGKLTDLRKHQEVIRTELEGEIRLSYEKQRKSDEKDHFKAIEKAHSDYAEIAQTQAFKDWLENHPLGGVYLQLLAPMEGEEGGSAGQVIRIYDEYKRDTDAGKPEPADEERKHRKEEAAKDNDGKIITSKTTLPTAGEAEIIKHSEMSKLQKEKPQEWARMRDKIQRAMNAGTYLYNQ